MVTSQPALTGSGIGAGGQVKDVDDIVAVSVVTDGFDLVKDALKFFLYVHKIVDPAHTVRSG